MAVQPDVILYDAGRKADSNKKADHWSCTDGLPLLLNTTGHLRFSSGGNSGTVSSTGLLHFAQLFGG